MGEGDTIIQEWMGVAEYFATIIMYCNSKFGDVEVFSDTQRLPCCKQNGGTKERSCLFIFQSGKTGNSYCSFSSQVKHKGIYLKSLKLSFYTGNLPPTLNKSGMWLQIFDFDSKF